MLNKTVVPVKSSEYVDNSRYVFTIEPGVEEYTTRLSVFDTDLNKIVVSSTLSSEHMVSITTNLNSGAVNLGLLSESDRALEQMMRDLAELRNHVLGGTVRTIRYNYLGQGVSHDVPNTTQPVPHMDVEVELFHTEKVTEASVPISTAKFAIKADNDHFGMLIHSIMGYNYVNSDRIESLHKLAESSIIDSRIDDWLTANS